MEFTVTIRPLRWIKNMILVCSMLPVLGFPNYMSVSAHDMPEDPIAEAKMSERQQLIARIEGELELLMTKAYPGEVHKVAMTLVDESEKAGFDPLFILAIMEAESNYDIEAVSPTGARGLMQLMPGTFKRVSDAKRMFDPIENVKAGILELARIRNEHQWKDIDTYLFAYNQGDGMVIAYYRKGVPMPEEAKMYIPTVIGKYKKVLAKFDRDPKQYRKLFKA